MNGCKRFAISSTSTTTSSYNSWVLRYSPTKRKLQRSLRILKPQKHYNKRELLLPEDERPARRDNATVDDEIATLQGEAVRLQTELDTEKKCVEKGGDYLSYAWNKDRRRNQQLCAETTEKRAHTRGFETLQLLRLRFSGGQLLQNYQLLRELLNSKLIDSHHVYQYRQWFELLSR